MSVENKSVPSKLWQLQPSGGNISVQAMHNYAQGYKHSLPSMHFSPSTSYIGHLRSPIRLTAKKIRFHTNTWRTTSY